MTPDKVSRTHVTFRRYWVGYFGKADDRGIRPLTLVSSAESKTEAEQNRRELMRWEHWASRSPEVVDLAVVVVQPECLMSEQSAHSAALNRYADENMRGAS